MSKPIPLTAWSEESFEASISVVRSLSEGRIHKDPQARVIAPVVKPQCVPVLSVVRPAVRGSGGSVKWQKWRANTAAKMGLSIEQFNRWRSQMQKAKGWGYYGKRKVMV